MKLDWKPTPQQAGHAIGLSMRRVPLIEFVSEDQVGQLKITGITEEDFINERYLLSASAALTAMHQAPLSSPHSEAVVASFLDYLSELSGSVRGNYLLAELHEVRQYYEEAAHDDAVMGKVEPGRMCEIELAFGDRLFRNFPESAELARAYFVLSMVGPKMIWDSQFSMAIQMLMDAELILRQ
jgi:hypothetical protein